MLPVLLWWLVIQLFALAVLPLTWRLFVRLPGRGYPLAKTVGLLLVAYLLWLGASLHLLPNDLGGGVLSLVLVSGLSFGLGRRAWQRDADGRRPLLMWLREQRGLVIVTEALFLVALVGWAAFRAYNPDIAYTEKPMEFAFINGVLHSRLFPPQDPWLAGYGISYYYFGYVMLALLIRLTGVASEVGFNLGVALWFALTLVTAFGVTYELVSLAAQRAGSQARSRGAPRAIAWALVAALFVGVVGNLEGAIDSAYQRNLAPTAAVEWLDIKGLTADQPTGAWVGNGWWWWRASRVIHDKDLLGNDVEVIDEFPLFSFLLGDMHPHVLALPFALLAIALALNLLLGTGSWKPETGSSAVGDRSGFQLQVSSFWRFLGDLTGLGTPGIVLYAVALGALGFLNTWDFPIYVGLATLALGAGLAQRAGLSLAAVGRALAGGLMFAVLGWLFYLPFYLGFQSQLGGILPNLLFPSRFSQFFVMFGIFLTAAVFFLALLSRGQGRDVLRRVAGVVPWTLLLPLLLLAIILFGLAVLPQGKAFVQEALNNPAVQANIGERSLAGLLSLVLRVRLATPWTYLALAVLIAWAAGLASVLVQRSSGAETILPIHQSTDLPIHQSTNLPIRQPTILPVTDLFTVLLIGLALTLALAPEFVYLRDLFGSRMNTVFKFYYQAWALLALVAAYGLSRLAERGTPLALKLPALALTGVLVLAGLVYPVLAIPSKADYFSMSPTLDGLAYLRRNSPADMAAIEWLRANVAPDAVVVEAMGGSYSEAARVSMATGNPTLLGWDFHERQWRGNDGYDTLAAGRPEALDRIYRSARPEELPGLLDEWGVDYVYVGPQERNKYGVGDAALARFDRALKRVYDQDGVRIYAR